MRKTLRLSMMVALAAVAVTGAALAQDMTPEEQQAMVQAMTPGEHHKLIAQFAGKYEYTSKMWMAPDAPAMESGGTSVAEMVMGGRYLQDTVEGVIMGMPFTGTGWTGYNNITGEYIFAWIDNFSTGIMTATGSCSPDGKVLTFEGASPQPGVPEPVPFIQVVTLIDDTHHKMEWYMPSEEGEMFKTMVLSYTRVK